MLTWDTVDPDGPFNATSTAEHIPVLVLKKKERQFESEVHILLQSTRPRAVALQTTTVWSYMSVRLPMPE